ncbi:MAG: hypothetical protein AB8H79_11440 [Myxococcota bacterium]
MASRFLLGYAHALVYALVQQELVDLVPDREEQAVAFLADYLERNRKGGSLISLSAAGLLDCPDVEELYADNDTLKDVVDGFGAR